MITFTLQQNLETVVTYLLNGGGQSIRNPQSPGVGGPVCLYRGPDGAKCFVGVMIPDIDYNPNWDDPNTEAKDAYELVSEEDLTIDLMDKEEGAEALVGLQKIHDNDNMWTADRKKFIGWGALKSWAKKWSLTLPENWPLQYA
tara:strand:+ start:400 stop:828 length:429 start_codon:yes stop_codon:yes gene_type:complete